MQKPAPETLQSLWKPFGGYREEKEGIPSVFRVTIMNYYMDWKPPRNLIVPNMIGQTKAFVKLS